MNRTVMFLVVIVTAYGSLTTSEYWHDASTTNNLDLQSITNSSSLADYGYRYKTFKLLRIPLRYRRNVSNLSLKNKYLPKFQLAPAVADFPVFFDVPPEARQESTVPPGNSYRYKTLQRTHSGSRLEDNQLPQKSDLLMPPFSFFLN